MRLRPRSSRGPEVPAGFSQAWSGQLFPETKPKPADSGSEVIVSENPRPQLSRSLLRTPRLWVGSAISVLALLLALRGIRWHEAGQALAQASALWVGLALATFLLTSWLKAVRWRLLFYPRHSSGPLRPFLSVLLIGQLANNVLPARSGDLLRAGLMGKKYGFGGALALATVVVEKALDSVLLLCLIAFLSLRASLPPWLGRSAILISSVLAGLLLSLTIVASRRAAIAATLDSWTERHRWLAVLDVLKRVAHASGELGALQTGKVQLALWGLTAAIWGIATSTNALVFRAMDLHISPLAAPLLLVVLMVGAILPTSPLQVGVFHYLCILTLGFFGVGQSVALSYAVLLHLLVMVPIALGGVVGLWLEHASLDGAGAARGVE